MGHRLLGQLPQTRNWRKVIDLLRQGADAARIAEVTSEAAKRGLKIAERDAGVVVAVHALMKMVWAAGDEKALDEAVGQMLTSERGATLLDLVGSFDEALDARLRLAGHRTDMAEMARSAAVEALGEICKAETGSLFGVTAEDAREALGRYATTDRFGHVGQEFFGRFLYKFLDYHLSRELPKHIGRQRAFMNIAAQDRFKDALELHCRQTARIVREFSGCWPSATEFREGITGENVRTKFLPVAFKKIRSELKRREKPNG